MVLGKIVPVSSSPVKQGSKAFGCSPVKPTRDIFLKNFVLENLDQVNYKMFLSPNSWIFFQRKNTFGLNLG